MNINRFIQVSELISKTEVEKVALLFYYHFVTNDMKYFSIQDLSEWFEEINLHKPNLSRLRDNLRKSPQFVKGPQKGTFLLHIREKAKYDEQFPLLKEPGQEVISDYNEILPESLYLTTRGYIELLAKQINAAYEENIFDGCAVLMRRLLEILLIHSYQNLKIEDQIQNANGDFKLLNDIIDNAKTNKILSLSRNSKERANNK
ncbi:hypothetical protein LJR153_000706 [Paenibacillus sp. LjRoot153]|uniref:hypothetical protein n=1 Tax=Paenibacillus sp. LjRoot153 TaxID=3342270 RepID=UPI003ECD9DBB